ncbi:STE13 Dipeptidyl aminopeptidase A [Candida maltosa Xu316]|uniref:Dipeptidyl aminopeptidase A n=1 Tax=Candida maltosa (strain Xu316) TaxID=1245528 RepID=M3K1G6_CANMX|nr:hypothetical protein G210_0862 [Candida maltosa Xu316]
MFTRKPSHHEEYEMVDQTTSSQNSVSTPTSLESSTRDSTDSQSSSVFEDLESYSFRSGSKIEDFNDNPLFQTILMRYRKQGINAKVCGFISILTVLLWIGSLILYSHLNSSKYISSLRWKTGMVSLNGENITINQYSPSFKNVSLSDWRSGRYYSFEEQIRWLTPKQYPKMKSGSGYYAVNEHGKVVIKQINSDVHDVLISNKKFAYGNNFFEIEDYILNPSNPVEELDNFHILITDQLPQWRQSSFALYWLYNPLTMIYQPIQPPGNKDFWDHQSDPLGTKVLQKLHFADFSPDGKYVYFGFEHNLYIQDLTGDNINQITTDGSPNIFNGKADWTYEEEVSPSDKMIWWTQNAEKFIFAKIDDTKVKEVELDYYVKENTDVGTTYQQSDVPKKEGVNQYPIKTSLKYPKTGSPNPSISLYIYDVKEKKAEKIVEDDPGNESILYYAKWLDNDNFLMKKTDRTSSILSKKLYQLSTNQVKTINSINVTAEYNGWVEKMSPITVLEDGKYIDNIVVNKQNSLALFDSPESSQPSKVITKNTNWEVIGGATYDKQEKFIYLLTTIKSSMDSHLIGIDLANDYKVVNITNTLTDGYYEVDFSIDGQFANLKYQGPDVPWQRLINMGDVHDFSASEESKEQSIEEGVLLKQPIINKPADLENINFPTTRFKEITIGKAKNNVSVNVMEILPPNFNPQKHKYSLFVHVYGGPGSQNVFKKFDIGFLQIISANLNCIVLVIDPRGTGGKGWNFRSFANRNLGYWEPRDLTLVTSEYITRNKDIINKENVAIWGWSYGGFTVLKTLEYDKGETFKYGMAVAPVTNWLFYDSIYTERYMGLPSENPKYETTGRINEINNFKLAKRLLIMHGTGDDNVHIQNSMWLLNEFNSHNVENYDVQFFPDSDHAIMYNNAGIIVFDKLFNWLQDAFTGKFDSFM